VLADPPQPVEQVSGGRQPHRSGVARATLSGWSRCVSAFTIAPQQISGAERMVASTQPPTTGITAGFVGAVGNTPLIRLNALSALTGCEILGKAEFMNPGGSVKDRAALGILLEAEQQGLLQPGGTVVEGTAGNTGIGLTHLCNARGYKALIVIPDTQSAEKIGLLRSLGAEVRTVPAVPYRDPNNYVRLSGRIAEETPGAVWANQFDNLANRRAHYNSTGPEIWHQTGGRVDAWVAATGTGGTYAGVALYLKEQNPAVRCVLADPHGSSLYSWATDGSLVSEGSSITEGIGNSRVTANLAGAPVDDAVRIADQDALDTIYRLLWQEGLFLGGSVGINVAAAVETARRLGPGHTIVTVLCDSGDRYRSRLYDAAWLAGRGLQQPVRAV
jgi:cysteine synthase A